MFTVYGYRYLNLLFPSRKTHRSHVIYVIYVEEEGVGYYLDYPLSCTSQRKTDGVDEDGAEPLLVTAVRNEDLNSVKVLLKYKADVEVQEHDLRDNWFSITRASLFWAVDFG